MSRLIVHSFTISLDGYGAGPNQSKETPLGEGGEELHEWLVGTRFFKQMGRQEGGVTGIDNDFAEQGMTNIGAFILGRNMFGPIRGPWPDDSWRGWWGKNPPYHTPTFVLTHYARPPQEMDGGTVFHFVTDGIGAALEQARSAAGDKDIRLLGGAPLFGSISSPAWWTRCTWRCPRACWAPVSPCSPALIFPTLDTAASGARQARRPCTT